MLKHCRTRRQVNLAQIASSISVALYLAVTPFVYASEIQAKRIERSSPQGAPTFISEPNVQLSGLGVSNEKNRWQVAAKNLIPQLRELYALDATASESIQITQTEQSGDIYFLKYRQDLHGIPVEGSSLTVVATTSGKINAISGTLLNLTPETIHSQNSAKLPDLVTITTQKLGYDKFKLNTVNHTRDESGHFNIIAEDNNNIRAKPIYFASQSKLVPAWKMEVPTRIGKRHQLWAVVIAESGEVLEKYSLTKDVAFNYRAHADQTGDFRPFDSPFGNTFTPHPTGTPGSALPAIVSSNIVTLQNVPFSQNDPWLPNNATSLTGNNADTYLDIDNINGFTAGDRKASATSALTFDYTLNTANAPTTQANQDAAMVNAFFIVNWLHDVFYDHGFNELSGNAQQSNFGRGGNQNDRLLIEVQDYEGLNNANMSVPGDGQSPRMQIFLWTGPSTHFARAAGTSYVTGPAGFGPVNFDITGDLALMVDSGGTSTTDGCEDLTNAAALNGKIALVDRGNCNFIDKVNRAQAAGAIAVLVANHSPGVLTMGKPDEVTVEPTIGSLIVSKANGDSIKLAMASATVSATLNRVTGQNVDGSLDSALVAHEWGHYLTNRLMSVGAPAQSNGMDEGWSDFIALMMMVRPEDAASNFAGSYGFSSYSGSDTYYGIRRLPYSSDFSKNALTFRHISNGQVLPPENLPKFGQGGTNNAEVHASGEVWCSMLWEAYSELLRTHDYTTAQSRMRTYTVNGMKAVAGSGPTFTAARDALLSVISDTTDRTIFRNAFAKRGLGVAAVSPVITDDTNANAVESYTWATTQKPVVTVSANQSVNEGANVAVTATASDPDGSIVSTQWKQVSGQSVTLTATSGLSTSFTAPSVTTSDVIVLRFIATDNVGEKADADVSITINGNNQSPTANAGADQTVTEGATVNLRGTATDADGQIVSYTWAKISGPDITLSPAAGPNVSFIAPQVDATTTIDIRLTVIDNDGLSGSDEVRITVNNTASTGGGSSGGGGSVTVGFLLLSVMGVLKRKLRRKQ